MIRLEEIGSLENLASLIKIIQVIIGNDDILIVVSDTEKVIEYFQGGSFQLPGEVGMKLDKRWGISKAMQKKESIITIMPETVYGITYRSICTPIMDSDGNAVGSIGFNVSLDRQQKLMEMADTLSESLKEISKGVEEISKNAQELSESNGSVTDSATKVQSDMKETHKVMDIVKDIAQRSNMLGINAAIESAKAGEFGRGFGVVADEIRKLSSGSQNAIKDVQLILSNTTKSVRGIVDDVIRNSSGVQQQAAAVEEINASIEELTAISDMLATYSKEF